MSHVLGDPTGGRARAGGEDVRRHNLALVLRTIAEEEPVSRAGLATATGLTRGTVSSLVEELIGDRLVRELAAERGATGRPASPLQLDRSGPAGLGIEIGVDHVGACVVDLAGTVRARRTAASAHRDSPASVALGAAALLARDTLAASGLTPAGAMVALPGVMGRDGTLQRAPNLPRWADVAVGDALRPLLDGLPVRVGNEADLAAMGERWAGEAPADMLYVSGEIGVGGAVVLGGELFGGAGGRAGEIGHVVVDPDGPACRCGGRGCLEQVAGQEALLRVAGVDDVARLIADGPVVDVAARSLGVALTGAVNVLDVPAVVLGGVYARLGEPLRAAVAAELAARTPWREPPDVRTAVLGADAALRGAATAVVRDVLARR